MDLGGPSPGRRGGAWAQLAWVPLGGCLIGRGAANGAGRACWRCSRRAAQARIEEPAFERFWPSKLSRINRWTARPLRGNPGRSGQNVFTLLEANPPLLDLYLKSFRASRADRFTWIYQKIGLTPDQAGRLEDLAAEREQEEVDLRAAAAAQGLPLTDPGIAALRRQADQQCGAAVIAAVGESASQQLAQSPVASEEGQGAINSLCGNSGSGSDIHGLRQGERGRPPSLMKFSRDPSGGGDRLRSIWARSGRKPPVSCRRLSSRVCSRSPRWARLTP